MKMKFQNTPEQIERVCNVLGSLEQDVPYILQITRFHPPRSQSENKYYWGVIVKAISDYTGMFDDEVHDALKQKFLTESIVLKNGIEMSYAKSTASLTTVEFEDYCRKIRIWANTDLGLNIPLPHENIDMRVY